MEQVRVSSIFPRSYGDFSIESSDGVVCYFPSQILSFMFVVFKDMIDFGGTEERGKPIPETPVKISESIETLELFLSHLNPNNISSSIDLATIANLLQMADKYQVDKIFQWFEQEATVQSTTADTLELKGAFAVTHPRLVLALASRFNFERAGRLAMRELVAGNFSLLLHPNLSVRHDLLNNLYQRRQARVKRYQTWIYELAADVKDGPTKICWRYAKLKGIWLHKMMVDVQTSPTWSSFVKAYEHARILTCDTEECRMKTWDTFYMKKLKVWKQDALSKESQLPPWPIKSSQ